MSIVEMQKIHIVSLSPHKEEILGLLQKNEVVDIQTFSESPPPPPDPQAMGKYEYQLAEINSAITFLEEASGRKKSFIETFIPPKEEVSEGELLQTCREFNCPDILKQCEGIENRLANLNNLRNGLLAELKKLLPWQKLDIVLNNLSCTVKTCLVLGKIKSRHLDALREKIEKLTEAVQLTVVNQTKDEAFLFMVYLTEDEKAFQQLLARSEFEKIVLPTSERTPSDEIAHIRQLLKKTEEETREVRLEAHHLSRYLKELKFMYDHTLDGKTDLEIQQKLAATHYTFVVEGWIKAVDYNKLKTELNQATPETEVIKIEPGLGEKPPVALKNPPILSPFELITKIYGTPKSSEFDPSLALSFFFALFFGICLGDFGYGIILALISLYFLKRYRLPEGGRNLFKLMLLGGGVATIVGVLTGSYLGFSPKEIPAALMPLKGFLTSLQIIDPVKSPLTMLIFSLALGVVQILFGIFLQMLQRIRQKDYVSAVLDDALWIFFLGSLVFLIVSNALSLATVKLASYMSIGGAVMLVLTQGRHKKNIVQKFLSGLLSLYRVSGYMGDTLSYSRLLALGMSSTIIGSVINILAGMVKSVPILGILLMIVLLIFGHIFNLLIGTLSAFVHSTRLQMVEFFSKFYEGGGREFKPYKRVAEYTILK